MIREIGVKIPLGMHIPIFLKDVLKVPKFIMGRKRTSNHFSRVPKEYIDNDKRDKDLSSSRNGYAYFSKVGSKFDFRVWLQIAPQCLPNDYLK